MTSTSWLSVFAWTSLLVATVLASVAIFCPGDQTIYSDGFSDRAFARIKPGMSRMEVKNILSSPVGIESRPNVESLIYRIKPPTKEISCHPVGSSEVLEIRFGVRNTVEEISGEVEGIGLGAKKASVIRQLGEPCDRRAAVVFWYSRPGERGLFRARGVAFDLDDLVDEIINYEWWD